MRKLFATLCSLLMLINSAGACMRAVPKDPTKRPDLDGPGAFGELQDTLTLDCLRFIGVLKKKDHFLAVLLDERGRKYEVGVGVLVGENTGQISEITEQRITLKQLVLGSDGEYVEVLRYVFREKGS